MSNILCPADGMVPALLEVKNPTLADRLRAIHIGSIELILTASQPLVDSIGENFNHLKSEVSDDDFETFLEVLTIFIEDPIMVLVREKVIDFSSFSEASKWFSEINAKSGEVPQIVRGKIIIALQSFLGDVHELLSEAFTDSVVVMDDGRIVIGRYDESL
jgi:hypothetical protein